MATEILATGNTAASSDDVTVASGDSLAVALKDNDGRGVVKIELKDDAGNYNEVAELSAAARQRSAVLDQAGTYRFTRLAGNQCGVFNA